ncbi:MAG: HAD-IA family hydrolase [Saprospiraceae bacterium]|nr:HAD-IA family hydrolase [Saprospiraceae bacterium]
MNERLLIFDCDGTLVDSEGIANEVFVSHVQNLGIPLTNEEAWEHFPGTSLALCMKYVEESFDVTLPDGFIGRYRQQQRIAFAEKLQPISGVKKALSELNSLKCVASNGPMDIIRRNLITAKLDRYFDDRIYSAYDLKKWKPLPDLFLHAANAHQMAPEDCVVVEDSEAGIKAGLNAGMTVLAFQPSHQKYMPNMEGTITFDDMAELPEVIASL